MSTISSWQTFLTNSLATRLPPETFESYVQILNSRHPLSPNRICDIFLHPREGNDYSLDTRATKYIQILLSLKLVNIPAILKTLLKVSSFSKHSEEQIGHNESVKDTQDGNGQKENGPARWWRNSYGAEETLFYRLAKIISSGSAPSKIEEAAELVKACIQWMEVVIAASHAAQEMMGLDQTHTQEKNAQNMALGTLVIAVVENAQVMHALSKGSVPKATRKELSKTLANFVPLLLQNSAQAAARLEVFRTETLVAIEPVDKKEMAADKAIEDILDESIGLAHGVDSMVVEEVPIMNSRAGLYIYLNSLVRITDIPLMPGASADSVQLVARPLIDDNAIFAYLHNRYQGDIETTIIDFILAAFDVLANATFRNEKPQAITILRSFLINKVPVMLTTLCAQLFPPLTSEYCITQALGRVDTTAFPTLSNMFDESSSANNMFSDSVRQDFCFACCLHGLIQESSIEELLGDIPMQSLPAGGRYIKDDLVQQCLSDPERAEVLIGELENMDGNVGAVSQAITEVIGRLCSNKETMSLKTLCSQLSRKPSSLDVILLFEKPVIILQPICELLDNWRYDEDQGEYQPVYEEFGSVLLLALSFTHRYGLSTVDLGIRNADGFLAKFLRQGHLARATEDLTEQENSHLDGWIRGLFDSGGLGDELMSSCPPHDFYMLVPTLFSTIVTACHCKYLSEKALKDGLEYLVDTFLLPSLIPGITWLASHLWESRGDSNACLQILSALITNPASISNNTEASQMLNAILNIVAKNLEIKLRYVQRFEPSRQDVEPLSKALRGNLGWERRGASDHNELEAWTATPGGGLTVAIKHTIASLVQWALNPTANTHPASYTHRQFLACEKIHDAKRLVHTILEEIKTQTEAGNASIVYDVACAIVCSPDSASWDAGIQVDVLGTNTFQPLQRRLNLREALKNEAENAPKLHKTDPFTADTIVRLYRKVEAQLVMPQQTMLEHDALGGLDSGLHQALDSAVLEGAMADAGMGMDGLDDNQHGLGGMNDPHGDLMHGLMGGGDAGDLLDGFGTGNFNSTDDGMGF
ncbi:related to Mediator of RNA polymerase II transcription subunit 5 [Phialocephala subalpina]|uniref:Mediator of RNA polymerase II transcription subunit 5 n=1 Tax=Phialocephala subalpina TaxID=576137 RepID=A0A1L7XK95_9HELO|nr:related to Mediator of RNA polymerase II transcription subunit 5 [Phialocephala subalpina]